MHPSEGTFFDATCAASTPDNFFKTVSACLKLARSLIRTTPFYSTPYSSIDELPEIGNPIDHLKFYKNAKHLAAFDTHRSSIGSGMGLLGDLERLQTTSIFNVPGFPTLCYSHHPDWPSLEWGKVSIKDGSRWPHPIG